MTVAAKRRPYAARLPAADRRDQLLDAALAIIVEDGYGAVSIDAIARRAGVTRPVVYGVFTDLRELLLALLDRQEQRALTRLLATASPPRSMSARHVEPVIRALVEMVRTDPETWRPIFVTFADAPAEVRARIDRDRELVRRQFQSMLEQANLRAGVDPVVLSHALVGMGEHFGRLLVTEPGRIDADALVRTVATTLASVTRR